jgi:hypothetical protein
MMGQVMKTVDQIKKIIIRFLIQKHQTLMMIGMPKVERRKRKKQQPK